jgi:branched-subunit amino acid transport protein
MLPIFKSNRQLTGANWWIILHAIVTFISKVYSLLPEGYYGFSAIIYKINFMSYLPG